MTKEFEQYLASLRAQARAETEGASRHMRPERETRPRSEIERKPDYFTRRAEHDGRSNWSGGNFGGGTWGGRGRGEREQP
jgi:hypothetical protein